MDLGLVAYAFTILSWEQRKEQWVIYMYVAMLHTALYWFILILYVIHG